MKDKYQEGHEFFTKGLYCEIYKNHYGDCSNGGLSHQHDAVCLMCSNGVFTPDDNHPAVYLRYRDVGGKTYVNAVPDDALENKTWYMMGGCFIWTSDSRFPAEYPVPLHDRVER